MNRFARAIEREATAPLLEQIGRLQGEIVSVLAKSKEDEALMRNALDRLRAGYAQEAFNILRQRLEAHG